MKPFALLMLIALTGCNSTGLLSPVTRDLKDLLSDPVVKETLQNWSADAEIHNPSIGAYVISGVELRLSGIEIKGEATGGSVTPSHGDEAEQTPEQVEETPAPTTQPAGEDL